MRTTLARIALAVIAVASIARVAHAETTILITGKIEPRQQTVILSSLTSALQQAKWPMIDLPFSAAEVASIDACLRKQQVPWTCIQPLAEPKHVDRLVVIDAEVDKGSKGGLMLLAQIVFAGSNVPPIKQRFCGPCTDSELAKASSDLASVLIAGHASRTTTTALRIETNPAGAEVNIDGKVVGDSGQLFPIDAGRHKVLLQLERYQPVAFEIEVREGETKVDRRELVLLDGSTAGVSSSGPSRVGPIAVGVAGLGAVVAGTWISLSVDPPGPNVENPKYLYSGPGIALAVGGVVAIGGSVAWWLYQNKREATSGATVSVGPSGAFAGWAGRF